MSDWREAATRALAERIDSEDEFDNVDDGDGDGLPDLQGGLDGGYEQGDSGAYGDPRALARAVRASRGSGPDIHGIVRGGLR